MYKLTDEDEVVLSIDGQEIVCHKSETVLDAAHRHNLRLSFSCRNGVCQSCMLRATEGQPSPRSQKGLKSTLVEQGYFLACRHELTADLSVSLEGASNTFSRVTVMSNEALSSDVYRIRLSQPKDVEYRTGQFINLRKESGEIRSYSLASVAGRDKLLELHIRRIRGGIVSTWLCDEMKMGRTLEISEARGDCFYVSRDRDQDKPILLMGAGTGLAPLYGIIRDALANNHTGEIFLYHGASKKDGLYLVDELTALEDTQPNFHYVPCLSGESGRFGFRKGRAHDVALADIKDLTDYLVFSCGNPEMVRSAKRRAFLQGASMQDIFGDAFLHASTTTALSKLSNAPSVG